MVIASELSSPQKPAGSTALKADPHPNLLGGIDFAADTGIDSTPVINVRSLDFWYSRQQALFDVTMDIRMQIC